MADTTFFSAEEEEDTSASVSKPVFFDSSEEEDFASSGDQAPASRPQGESPIPLASKDEAKAKGEMGITETAQRDYEAATGAEAPKNPILAQIANMGLTVGGKLNANLQMQAAQRLASGRDYDDAQVDDLMDQMVYGGVKKVNEAMRTVPTVGMPGMIPMSRPQETRHVQNEIMRDWDATEGRRIVDPEERRHARMLYAAQIADDFLKERTAVRQNAETELESRDITHTANVVSRGLGMVGYSLPYFLGPVGIGLQLLEEGSANAVGYANDRHGFDDGGKFRLVAQGDDAGRAALAGFGTAGIETATEVVGGKIGGAVAKRLAKTAAAPVGKVTKRIAQAAVGKFPVAKVVGSKVAATPVGKVALAFGRGLANAFKWTSKTFHLENPVEENIEELESAWMNAITGWDRRASELVDPETGERTNPFGRFIDANVDFFKPSSIIELNEAMLITMGGGAFVGMMARRRAVKQVDNIIREHNLMTEKELKEASLEAKSEALDAWAKGLDEKETIAKIEKATGWVDRLADKIKGERGKFAGEVNALREKMAEREAYNTGAELDRLDVPHQRFNIPMRQDGRGRNVPDFRQVVMANTETGESATRNAVYDESGIAIVDNEGDGDAAYTVVSADGRSSRDFPTLTQAVRFATAEKNRTALELARDQMKQQVIANEVEANYGGANVVDVRTADEAVEAGKRLTGEDVSADPNFHPGRKGWRLKDGTILLVRDNLSSPNDVARLLRHEAVGHDEGMMQDRWFESDEESQVGRLRERNLEKTMKDGPARERDVRRALRETVANVVQRRRHAPDIVDRGVGAIRAAMRNLGFDLKMNDTDLEVAVGRIEKSLREGKDGVHESKDALSGINMEYREVTPADEAAEAGKGQENADETGNQSDEAPAQPEPDAKRPAGEEAHGDGAGGEAQGAEPGVEPATKVSTESARRADLHAEEIKAEIARLRGVKTWADLQNARRPDKDSAAKKAGYWEDDAASADYERRYGGLVEEYRAELRRAKDAAKADGTRKSDAYADLLRRKTEQMKRARTADDCRKAGLDTPDAKRAWAAVIDSEPAIADFKSRHMPILDAFHEARRAAEKRTGDGTEGTASGKANIRRAVIDEGCKSVKASPNAKSDNTGKVVYTPKDGGKPFTVGRNAFEHSLRGANAEDNAVVGRHLGEALDASTPVGERSENATFRIAPVRVNGEDAHVLFTVVDGKMTDFDVLKGYNTKKNPEGMMSEVGEADAAKAFEVRADSIANLDRAWQERFKPGLVEHAKRKGFPLVFTAETRTEEAQTSAPAPEAPSAPVSKSKYMGGNDLSKEDNARFFKTYMKNIAPSTGPKKLSDGSPKAALRWFIENMVGKTYTFEIPGIGLRTFRPKAGHIGKLVCEGANKGIINRKYEGQWIDAVLNGEISAADVNGWDYERARSLPLIDDMLNSFDAVIVDESGRDTALVFVKKYATGNGRSNTVVMKVVQDGATIGPISAHIKDLSMTWLMNKKRLVINEDGELLNRSADNSASRRPLSKDSAENNSHESGGIVPQPDPSAQGAGRRLAPKTVEMPPQGEMSLKDAVEHLRKVRDENAAPEEVERADAAVEAARAPDRPFDPPKPKPNAKAAAKVVGEFVSKDKKRTTLLAPYHDKANGVVIATNGRILIATKHGFDPNAADRQFPKWQQAVPADKDLTRRVTVNPSALAKSCAEAVRLARATGSKMSNGEDRPYVVLRFGDMDAIYDAEHLGKVARAMEANGITEIRAGDNPNVSPLVARNGETVVVQMPLRRNAVDFRTGRHADNHSIIISGESGRVLAAPERTDIGSLGREGVDAATGDGATLRRNAADRLGKSPHYMRIKQARQRGETDAAKVYGDRWENLNPESREIVERALRAKTDAEAESALIDYFVANSPEFAEMNRKNLSMIVKAEKRIAAEDALEALVMRRADADAYLGRKPNGAPETPVSKTETTEGEPAKADKGKSDRLNHRGEASSRLEPQGRSDLSKTTKDTSSAAGNSLDGYLAGKKPMDAARIRKTLGKERRYVEDLRREDGEVEIVERVESEAAFVERSAKEGATLSATYTVSKGGKAKVEYTLAGQFVSKTAADYARHLGMNVDENEIARSEEAVRLKEVQSLGMGVRKLDYSASDKNIERRLSELGLRSKIIGSRSDLIAEFDALKDIKAARIKRGDWNPGVENDGNAESRKPPKPDAEASDRTGNAAYHEWLAKYGLQDTEKNRVEWNRKFGEKTKGVTEGQKQKSADGVRASAQAHENAPASSPKEAKAAKATTSLKGAERGKEARFVASLEIPEEGVKRVDAVAALNALKGGMFTNRATGISARLSSVGAGKLISNKAVAKSLANGFTAQQHNALAAHIDSLYENAVLVEERPDRNGDVNVRSIRRFVCPIRIGKAEACAYITVKESVEHGNRIYSVEGIKIAALSPTVRRAIAGHNSADNAASINSKISDSADGVNGGGRDAQFVHGTDYTVGKARALETANAAKEVATTPRTVVLKDAKRAEKAKELASSLMSDFDSPEFDPLRQDAGNGTIRAVDERKVRAIVDALSSGTLRHPRFTRQEVKASNGTEHGKFWNIVLSLEPADVYAGGGASGPSCTGGDDSQGGKGLGLLRELATRYGRSPVETVGERRKYLDGGIESKVFLNENNKVVIKVRRLSAYSVDGVVGELAKIAYHNYLFPKDAYTLVDLAVHENGGYDEYYLVLEQPFVTPLTDGRGNIVLPTDDQIFAALQGTPERFSIVNDVAESVAVEAAKTMAYNGQHVVYDFQPGRNTFIDAKTGEVRFIDPRVNLNDPGAGFSVSRFGERNSKGTVRRKSSMSYENYDDIAVDDGLDFDSPELDSARREYDEVVARFTNANGTRKPGWMKAPNGKKTNLSERQWVQVRTPSFKKWFGDWEREAVMAGWRDVADARRFAAMPAEDVSAVPPLVGKVAFKAAFAAWGEVTNAADGRRVVFPNASAGKMERVGKVSGALNALFERSLHAWSENDDGRHNNIAAIHHYIAKAKTSDGDVYVHFTVREDLGASNAVHAATVSSVDVYKKNAEITPGKNLAKSADESAEILPGKDLATSAPFVDNKIAYLLGEVNPASVSKVVDANGEPLVVYRGASFDPIAQNPGEGIIMEGAYFSPNPEYARRYGKVRAYYLNIRSPFDIRDRACIRDLKRIYPDHEFATGISGALDWGEATVVDQEFLEDNFGEKYDGLVYDEGGDVTDGESTAYGGMKHRGISYVPAKGGAQVKSATDNAGAFGVRNPDIRFDSPELDAPGIRFSAGRVNPHLREEVEAALNTDRNTKAVLPGHAEVVFAEGTPQVLQDAGIQDGRIYTHAFILRKIRKDHGIDADGMRRLADAVSRPVAILRDVMNKKEAAYIILTEQSAKDLNGRISPVMVYLREDKRGNYLASAYLKTENGERQFVNLVNAGGLLALNKNKVTDLNLTGEVKSSFESVKIGDKVIDLSRSTLRIVPQSDPSAQGGAAKFSVSRVTPEEDATYLDAVRRGDMEAAQRLLRSAWERSGYSDDTSYKDAHAAPCAPVDAKDFRNAEALLEARDEGWDLNLWAVAKGITGQPDDFFSDSGPRLYGYDDAAGRETQEAVAQTIDLIRAGADNAKIIVYRAVPKSVKLDTLQSGGQWVSPSRTYAENHGKSRFGIGKYRVVREVVRADELWWDGNDAREWGYDDGRQYVYMNGENGKKLATVTYDGAGKVIPLSERFNPDKPDIDFDSPELDPGVFRRRVDAMEKLVTTLKEEGYGDFRSLETYLAENFPKERFNAARPYLRGLWDAMEKRMKPYSRDVTECVRRVARSWEAANAVEGQAAMEDLKKSIEDGGAFPDDGTVEEISRQIKDPSRRKQFADNMRQWREWSEKPSIADEATHLADEVDATEEEEVNAGGGRPDAAPKKTAPNGSATLSQDDPLPQGTETTGKMRGIVTPQSFLKEAHRLFPDVAIRGKGTARMATWAGGHFEPTFRVIRSRDMNAIGTVTHELGHELEHLTRYDLPRTPAAKRDLSRLGHDLYPPNGPKPNSYIGEGFAEYIRGYICNAENLSAVAPNMDAWFRGDFKSKHPEIVKKIDQLRDMVQTLKEQSAADTVRGFRHPATTVAERAWKKVTNFLSSENWNDSASIILKGMRKSGIDKLYRWQDEFKELEAAIRVGDTAKAQSLAKSVSDKIANNPYLFPTIVRGTASQRVMDMARYGTTNLLGNRKTGESLKEIFADFSHEEQEDWKDYAIARHGLENYYAKGLEFGLPKETLEAVVRQYESPKFRQALQRVTDYSHRILHLGVDAGLLSQETYDSIVASHPIYVRITRRKSDDMAGARQGGAAVNRRTGGFENILDPIDAMLMDEEKFLRACFQARSLQLIIGAANRAKAANLKSIEDNGGPNTSVVDPKDQSHIAVGAYWPIEVPNAKEKVTFSAGKIEKGLTDAAEDYSSRTGEDLVPIQQFISDLATHRDAQGQVAQLSIFHDKPSQGKHNLVSVYIDGNLHTYELPDMKWANMLTDIYDKSDFNWLERGFGLATAGIRLGATTVNPGFAIRNGIRDSFHSAVMSETGALPMLGSLNGMLNQIMGKEAATMFRSMGGHMSDLVGVTKEQKWHHGGQVALAQNALQSLQAYGAADWMLMKPVIKAASDILSFPELGPRIREFNAVLEKCRKAGLDEDVCAMLAMSHAKDISIDFQRAGRYMKRINHFIPFANATWRGTEQTLRNLGVVSALPHQFDDKNLSRGAKTVGKGLAYITSWTVALALMEMSGDDDDKRRVFERDPVEKWEYMHIGDWRIPLPFETGYLFGAIPKAIIYEMNGDKGAIAECLKCFAKAMPTKYLDPTMAIGAISLFAPIIGLLMNEDYRGRAIVPEHVSRNRIKEDWYTPYTTELSKRLGRAIGQSPAQIEYLFDSYTGGLYRRTALAAENIGDMSRLMEGRGFSMLDTLRARPQANRLVGDFYRFGKEAQQRLGSGVISLEDYGKFKSMTSVKKELTERFDEIRAIRADKSISLAEQDRRVQTIASGVNETVRDFNARDDFRQRGIAYAAKELTDVEPRDLDEGIRKKLLGLLKGIPSKEISNALIRFGYEPIMVKQKGVKVPHQRWSPDNITKRMLRLYLLLRKR